MKVAIVAPYFHPLVGGAEVYTINIARQLKAMGWEVVIVTTGEHSLHAPETLEGMRVYRLKVLMKVSNTPIGIGWRRDLRRIFSIEKLDVINAHTPVPYVADMAERASGKIPFVLTYHNDLAKDTPLAKLLVWGAHHLLISHTLRRSADHASPELAGPGSRSGGSSRRLRQRRDRRNVVPPPLLLVSSRCVVCVAWSPLFRPVPHQAGIPAPRVVAVTASTWA